MKKTHELTVTFSFESFASKQELAGALKKFFAETAMHFKVEVPAGVITCKITDVV